MATNQRHNCIKEAIIKELADKISHLETEIEIQKNNINAVKEDIKDMKSDIKDLNKKVEEGFKKIDVWLIGLLTAIVIGIVVNLVK
jgi:predicted  nucleic acid-binding Zn-ribbon protein